MTRVSCLAGILLSSMPAAVLGQEISRCRFGELPYPTEVRAGAAAQSGTAGSLAVFYAVPADVPFSAAVLSRIADATLDIQAWYQCATGGLTWRPAYSELVRVYFAQETREYYRDHGNWWGSLFAEMQGNGLPVWSPGTVTAVWAHGAGWWAGAAQACAGDCGMALLGVELFAEFNNPEFSGGECPGGGGVGAFPCTPEGAFAHELGHTVGLPHPLDVPETQEVAGHSIMQTHWNYPDWAPPSESPWGFLSLERVSLLPNPFLHTGIELFQTHDCDVVNLPDNGQAPLASFDYQLENRTISTFNTTAGALLHYWTFGDGSVSNDFDAVHTYGQSGSYPLTLRATADNGMMDRASAEVEIVASDDSDEDGVPDGSDLCPGTEIPEEVPTVRLRPNRFALVDDDGIFDTVPPHGGSSGAVFTIADTRGCSCDQIIRTARLDRRHRRFGCALWVMQTWVEVVNR